MDERLWNLDLEYSVVHKNTNSRIGTLGVVDVLLIGDRAYVLYMHSGSALVANPTRNKDGEWIWSEPTHLARSTDVYPIVKVNFTPRDTPQIAIDMIVADKVRTRSGI
jgi:hypothetical protein